MTALALMYTGQQPELSRVHSSPGARLPDWLAAGHFCVHSIKKNGARLPDWLAAG